MEQLLFANNAVTNVAGTLTSGATTINVTTGTGSLLPNPAASQAFLATIYELDVNSNPTRLEVVKCTARTNDALTVVRDFENMASGGFSYPSTVGKTVYLGMFETARMMQEFLQANRNLADVASPETARVNLNLGFVDRILQLNGVI